MKYSVIIPAAGSSNRFQKDKMLIKLNNELLIKHTVYNFKNDPDCTKIALVVSSHKFDFYKNLFRLVNKLLVVRGANTRSESVYNGLEHCLKNEYVLIHDGARPYLSFDVLERIKTQINNNHDDLVLLYYPVYDSIIKTDLDQKIEYVNREEYKIIQTPQAFKTDLLYKSYQQLHKETELLNFTDEISLVIHYYPQIKPAYVLGSIKNKKITTPDDLSEIDYDNN